MLIGGRGLARREELLPPLTPGELLIVEVAAEWIGGGSVALARDLAGVQVFAEEQDRQVPLATDPTALTAGAVPVSVQGPFGTVQTTVDVPAGAGGTIFDPLPYLPASVDLLRVPAGARVRVVVETPDGEALARSFAVAADAGELDPETGARVVDRLTVDSLTGGSAGLFVVHPVLGNRVVSALLAPGQSSALDVDWTAMDGVDTLRRRYADWRVRDRAIRARIREPLVPSLVALIGGAVAAAALGAGAAVTDQEVAQARKDAVGAAAQGRDSAVAAAWTRFQDGKSHATELRVAASVAGGFSAAGIGLTIGFGVRGAGLRRTVPPWDPWSLEEGSSKTP